VAERINRRLAERFSVAGQTMSVGASTGIANGLAAGTTAEELIRDADVAMYQAKQGGQRSYQLFESGMEVPHRPSPPDPLPNGSSRPLHPSYHPADAGG
jgi:predicted signal transduction protein with EAL and GGDEF domain